MTKSGRGTPCSALIYFAALSTEEVDKLHSADSMSVSSWAKAKWRATNFFLVPFRKVDWLKKLYMQPFRKVDWTSPCRSLIMTSWTSHSLCISLLPTPLSHSYLTDSPFGLGSSGREMSEKHEWTRKSRSVRFARYRDSLVRFVTWLPREWACSPECISWPHTHIPSSHGP